MATALSSQTGQTDPVCFSTQQPEPRGGSARRPPHLHAACPGTVECLPQAQLAHTLDPRTLICAADWGPIQALSNRRKIKFHAILSSGVRLSRGHPACGACYKPCSAAAGSGTTGRDEAMQQPPTRSKMGANTCSPYNLFHASPASGPLCSEINHNHGKDCEDSPVEAATHLPRNPAVAVVSLIEPTAVLIILSGVGTRHLPSLDAPTPKRSWGAPTPACPLQSS